MARLSVFLMLDLQRMKMEFGLGSILNYDSRTSSGSCLFAGAYRDGSFLDQRDLKNDSVVERLESFEFGA